MSKIMYANLADMRERFEESELLQLSDETGAGEINQAKIDRAIEDATHEINSYLTTRFKLPLSPVPLILVKMTCEIARFNLWATKVETPEAVKQRYQAAIKFLQSAARGEITFDQDNGQEPAQEQTAIFTGPPRRASREKLKGF